MSSMMWLLIVLAVLGTLLATVMLARRPHARRIGRCPINANTVVAEVGASFWTGEPVDVTACSEFAPRTDVRCDKRCLRYGFR
jgi:hypothetical protein